MPVHRPPFTRWFLYHPTRAPVARLARGAWRVERMPVGDGVELVGLVREGDPGEPWLLFFGGNAMGLDAIQSVLGMIAGSARWGLCAFAYRGYDGSGGRPTEKAILRDARTIARTLASRCDVVPERLVLLGQSLGSGVAADLAAYLSRGGTPAAGLVLLSPFTSIAQVFDDHVPLVPIKWMVVDRYETDALLGDLPAPVLLIHGREDRLIDFEHSRRLATGLGERAELVGLEGRAHDDLWEDRRTVLAVRALVAGASLKPATGRSPSHDPRRGAN
jgi:hypothetical protein